MLADASVFEVIKFDAAFWLIDLSHNLCRSRFKVTDVVLFFVKVNYYSQEVFYSCDTLRCMLSVAHVSGSCILCIGN